MKKRIALFLVAILCTYPLGRLYYRWTDGFRVAHITEPFVWHPSWETSPPTPAVEEEVVHALNQEYFYLGKGCQSYVFSSADGRYVLKFFKYQRYRNSLFWSWFPAYAFHKRIKKQEKRERFCQSWKLAYEQLSSETGILSVHLNTTEKERPLVLYDKLGFRHTLNLSQHQYLLQRKGIPLTTALSEWEKEGEREKSVACLEQLITMLIDEYKRGIFDRDPALVQNTGVLGELPVHLDVGQFFWERDRKGLPLYKQDFINKMMDLYEWLSPRYPELGVWVEEMLVDRLGEDTSLLQATHERCY